MIKIYLKRILHFLHNNLKTLIISVILSIIIWFAISIQLFPNVYDHIDGIPVQYEPTDFMQSENLSIVGFEQRVTIQIQGKRYVIGTLSSEDFTATLDLSGITGPGTHTVNVNVIANEPSDDCEIVSRTITTKIEVQRIISKEIEITANLSSLELGEGLQVQSDELVISPATITVEGEESLVNSIESVVIDPIYDSAITQTTELRGEISLFNSEGTMLDNPALSYRNDGYTVTVPVYYVKTLPLNVSLVAPSGFELDSLRYTLLPNEITIAAPATDASIRNMDRIDIGEINISDITSRDLQGIKLTISLPDGYRNLSNIGIAQVNFENVESYGQLEFTVPSENFSILNGDSAYDFEFVTNQLDVTVVGPSGVLQNISTDDITGTVNLLGVQSEESVRNVTITVRIAGSDTTAWVAGEYKIDIRSTLKTEEEE